MKFSQIPIEPICEFCNYWRRSVDPYAGYCTIKKSRGEINYGTWSYHTCDEE